MAADSDHTTRPVSYWEERWDTGKTGWHQATPDTQLVANAHLLLPPPDKHRVFIPLCGKSLDILWFYQAGHTVVGLEGVETVVQQFGEENNIALQVSAHEWGKLYQTEDARLQLYVCDLFLAPLQQMGKFDALWDRGSFVAIDVADRPRYATLIKSLLATEFRYLLSAVEYKANDVFSGPPCSLSKEEVEALLGDVAITETLHSLTSVDHSFGSFTEVCFYLSTKPQ